MRKMAAPSNVSTTETMSSIQYRVLELYSGIGGMHYALKESGLSFEVVKAIDVNTNANAIYRLNFPDTDVVTRGIEGLSVKDFDKLDIDMILMSPPCQPFTRVGKKQDTQDKRTRSFLHLLEQIPRLKKCPSYILLENVKGFEVSETRDRLIEMLDKCQYVYQEMLLTPLQFGIPNSRLRYYLIAKRSPLKFAFERKPEIMDELPTCAAAWMKYKILAESTQHQCVCGGYSSEEVELRETGSVSNRLVTVGKHQENLTDNQYSHSAQSGEGLESNLGNSADIPGPVTGENKRISDTDRIEVEDSETHPCAKRLKVENKNKMEDSTYNNNNAHDDSLKTESNKQSAVCQNCLENYGLNMRQEQRQGNLGPCLSLSHFLEDSNEVDNFKPYNIPEDMLKRFIVMDIINPCSRKSTCFTKRYGHFVNGAGSVFQMAKDVQAVEQASTLKEHAIQSKDRADWSKSELHVIRSLQLRYFTPREIANILCFPKSFSFPSDLTNRQLYMVLGNSLNVHVVSLLIRLMVLEASSLNTTG